MSSCIELQNVVRLDDMIILQVEKWRDDTWSSFLAAIDLSTLPKSSNHFHKFPIAVNGEVSLYMNSKQIVQSFDGIVKREWEYKTCCHSKRLKKLAMICYLDVLDYVIRILIVPL